MGELGHHPMLGINGAAVSSNGSPLMTEILFLLAEDGRRSDPCCEGSAPATCSRTWLGYATSYDAIKENMRAK